MLIIISRAIKKSRNPTRSGGLGFECCKDPPIGDHVIIPNREDHEIIPLPTRSGGFEIYMLQGPPYWGS